MIADVLPLFGLGDKKVSVAPFGGGLINRTWKVSAGDKAFILQRVNDQVFTKPADIVHNCRLMADYLQKYYPDYLFVAPLEARDGNTLVYREGDGWYRLFPFVQGSRTLETVETPQQAFEAARQFGRFTRLLSGINVAQLKTTIPHFHDLALRYQQFLHALQNGNKKRIKAARAIANALLAREEVVKQYKAIKEDPAFRLRVTHHDTKISNVLFDRNNKGLCVIDLDTVMPGYFISDVGDMMRTYLSPVSEEEADFSKIVVREEFYKGVVEGYCSEMKNELTTEERKCFHYAGKFMVYMQALRFFTDYLHDDVYYGARYEGHNLVRARNQLVLLEQLVKKQVVLKESTAVSVA